jgi:hypothetical protein
MTTGTTQVACQLLPSSIPRSIYYSAGLFFKALNLAVNENYMRYQHLPRRKLQSAPFYCYAFNTVLSEKKSFIPLCRTNTTDMHFPPRRKHAIPQGSNLPNDQVRWTLPSVSSFQRKRSPCLKQTDE